MNTATVVKAHLNEMRGNASLYKLTPPFVETVTSYDSDDNEIVGTKEHEYVVVSTVNAFGMGIETYIFPANEDGKITDFGELPGSQRGTSSHALVLSDMGYTIA